MTRQETNTRERILLSAINALSDQGYRGMILENLADAAGIRAPTIFYHFPKGKEQIQSEVYQRIYQSLESLLKEEVSGPQGPVDTLASLCDKFWNYCGSHRQYVRLLCREWLEMDRLLMGALTDIVAPLADTARQYIGIQQQAGHLDKFNIDGFMYSVAAQIFTFHALPGMRHGL